MTHQDLKEAAMKATPGPWADGNEALFVGGSETMVTEPRDFGYLRPEWKKHKRKP